MDENFKHCIDVCNRLLRGERSAVGAYDKVIDKFGDQQQVAPELVRIRNEHRSAVTVLERNVMSMGGNPDSSSGPWGAFASTVQDAANFFGAGSALKSLEAGEVTGQVDYQSAINDEHVMTSCRELIRSNLLPVVEEHIRTLERLQKAA